MPASNELTESEQRVLEMLATSLTRSGIARELYLSVNTIKTHIARIFEKLGVTTRDEAIERARAQGLLPPGTSDPDKDVPFAALVRHCRYLITIVDAERRLVWADPSYQEMLGEAPEAHLGRPAWEIVHPDDRDELGSVFKEIRERPGASVTFQCRLAHADGTWRRVEVHQVNRLDDPEVRGFVGTTRALPDQLALAE